VRTVFTNGCFDILHVGHVKLLEFCHDLAYKSSGGPSRVVVGLNSDSSVTKLKGPHRPVNTERDRQLILESLRFVDDVIIFHENTPYNLLLQLKPDILVKGGDYDSSITDKSDPRYVVGSDLCELVIFNTVDNYSTTSIINTLNL
jgi:D-beta-D-heptose 7-phosphate kinase/D-beta-D-heptose 1-phosphate adenosyltransferase